MAQSDLVSRVADRLERAILSGEFAPGDPLPAEREISARMRVSRSVVREAIGRLVSLGLVKSVHGSGTRVQEPTSKPIVLGYRRLLHGAGLENLSAVRLPLETTIAALAATTRTADQLERLEKTQAVLANPRVSLEAHVKADMEFHAILAEATGNPLFQLVLAPIQELLIESRRRTLGRYGSKLAHGHHARILEAIRGGDAAAAEAAMCEHLRANVSHLSGLGQASASAAAPRARPKSGQTNSV
ncbi:MAG: FadR family transcriptional regulator [Planctomycetes bacterium]|nr:FadR family transcriptional regulator [Planctomycetota bacterium]